MVVGERRPTRVYQQWTNRVIIPLVIIMAAVSACREHRTFVPNVCEIRELLQVGFNSFGWSELGVLLRYFVLRKNGTLGARGSQHSYQGRCTLRNSIHIPLSSYLDSKDSGVLQLYPSIRLHMVRYKLILVIIFHHAQSHIAQLSGKPNLIFVCFIGTIHFPKVCLDISTS